MDTSRCRLAMFGAIVTVVASGRPCGALDLPLVFLNGGPSSQSIPQLPSDPVATFRFPREIVEPFVFLDGEQQRTIGAALTDSTLIQSDVDPTGRGLRARSRVVLEGINVQASGAFEIIARSAFDVDAGESYMLFLDADDAAGITTIEDLEAFAGAGSSLVGTGISGTDFVKILLGNNTLGGTDLGLVDGQLTSALLAAGVQVSLPSLLLADPGAAGIADGAPGKWRDFEVAIVVLEDAAPGDQQSDLATEWACVGNGSRVQPIAASFDPETKTIRIDTSRQLEDDDAFQNPGDTNDGALLGQHLRVRVGGTGTLQDLSMFLASFDPPLSVAYFDVSGARNDVMEIVLKEFASGSVTQVIQSSRIGFFSTSPVFGVAGSNPNGSTATFQLMHPPQDPGCAEDIDGDGDVDFADLNMLLNRFNSACQPRR